MATLHCVQETSTCTPIKDPPTHSSTSLVVDVLMRGAKRWWKKTGVRSVSHKAHRDFSSLVLHCDSAVKTQ